MVECWKHQGILSSCIRLQGMGKGSAPLTHILFLKWNLDPLKIMLWTHEIWSHYNHHGLDGPELPKQWNLMFTLQFSKINQIYFSENFIRIKVI